jgi:prepilin-type N-terminal cleavage/methylation domain-containing protein
MKSQSRFKRSVRRGAFTLIEVLIVVTVVSVLMAIALPALAAAKQRADYARWQAYSHGIKSDQDVVAYYNFEQELRFDTLENIAMGDPHNTNYAAEKYDAQIDTPDWSQDGRFAGKGALTFTRSRFGTGVMIDPSAGNLSPDRFSLIGWVRYDALRDRGALVSRWGDAGGERGWRLEFIDNNLRFDASSNGRAGRRNLARIEADVAEYHGEWMQFAVTFDQVEVKLYINGELRDSAALEGIFDNEDPIYIGGGGGNGRSRRLDGAIDELALYKRALDSDEIRDHYNAGRP